MKIWDIIKSANANLLRNKGRSFLTILAVFVGAFTIMLTTGINSGVNGYIDTQVNSIGSKDILELQAASVDDMMGGLMSSEPKEYQEDKKQSTVSDVQITDEQLDKARQIQGIKSVSPFLITQTSAAGPSIEYVTGINDKKYELGTRSSVDGINIDMATGRMADNNRGEYEIAISSEYVTALGFSSNNDAVGQKIRLAVPDRATSQLDEVEATITGVMNRSILSMTGSMVNDALADKIIELSEQNLPPTMRGNHIGASAQLESNLSDSDIKRIKDEMKDLGISAMTVDEEIGMIKSFFDAVTTILTIFGAIALLAASIGIINTLFMAVQERTREIGLMKAMGLGKGKIRAMFDLEAIALGFWGSVLGVLLAYGAKELANNLANETFLKDLPGFVLVQFHPVDLIVIVLAVMFIALLAGALPARRASKLNPIDALRYE